MKASTRVGAILMPNFRKLTMHEKGAGQSKEDATSQTFTATCLWILSICYWPEGPRLDVKLLSW